MEWNDQLRNDDDVPVIIRNTYSVRKLSDRADSDGNFTYHIGREAYGYCRDATGRLQWR